MNSKLRIFTWHVHGSYLYYLSKGDFDLYIPVNKNKTEGYSGRGETFRFGNNVIEVPAEEVRNMDFDLILFQSHKNYLADQYETLSEAQRMLPRIYIEHDPPRNQPTDTIHPVGAHDVLVVHVSYFNQLMWHNAGPAKVIEHGVAEPDTLYKGEKKRGLVVVNDLHKRGRRLGADIFDAVSEEVPLDLIGMGTEEHGGLGEILFHDLPRFASRYRFFFNPIRYTSLGLAFLEAMRAGMPVVCLATTEYATVINNGSNGYAHTDVDFLIEKMQLLLKDKNHAAAIGLRGKTTADERYNLQRFVADWKETFINQIQKFKQYEKAHSIYQ